MTEESAESCQTCGGHGFRVEIAPGQTVNVKTAQELGLMTGTGRVLCHCQPVDASIKDPGEKEAAKPQSKPKPKSRKSIDVAGIKSNAYVDPA